MHEIRDEKLLEHYLLKHQIPDCFTARDLPFRLYCYEPGEMMNILRPTEVYLKFVLCGSFELYTVRPDGVRYLIRHCSGFGFLGDMEFCGKAPGNRYQEVTERVLTVELPMEPLRPVLEQDPKFLRFLLDMTTDKLSAPMTGEFRDLEEALLCHLHNACPEGKLHGVEQTAFHLNCSRRQLQRVLRALTDRGVLRRTGRGVYELTGMLPV